MKCPLCNGTGVMKARDRAEAQNGLNDVYAGDPYPCTGCRPWLAEAERLNASESSNKDLA